MLAIFATNYTIRANQQGEHLLNQRTTLYRILKFCCSGGCGVSIYYLTLYCLTEYADVWYLASVITASALCHVTNFTLQKIWTFQNKEVDAITTQAIKYLAMAVSFMLINSASIYVLVEFVRLQYLVAALIMTIILSIVSYGITSKIFQTNVS